MKIFVVSQYYYPEQFRINDITYELVKRGHSVTVLTGLPNYPFGEIFDGYKDSYKAITNFCGVRVIRCKLRPRHKGSKNLVFNYFSFVRQATKRIKTIKEEFDVIFVYGISPITQAIPAIRFGKKHNIPVIYYCLDLWPESVLGEQNGHKQIGRKNPVYIFAKVISKYIYKRVDKIAVKCVSFKEYLINFGFATPKKVSLLYEHAEETYLSVKESPNKNGVIDFMFLGNIGKIQNCNQIVDAFYRVKCDVPIKLHFVGGGSELEAIKNQVEKLNVSDRVVFHDSCSVSETMSYYNLADICIVSLSNKTMTGLTIPAKLMGYMAAARPVIASINGESKEIIEKANCGFVCSADSVDELTQTMQKAINKSNELVQLGKNGRRFFINNFTIETFINSVEELMKSLLK